MGIWEYEDYARTTRCTDAPRTREVGTRLLAQAQILVPGLTSVLPAQALETAMQFEISAYDARFITLARHMRLKLVTEDAKLRAAVPDWTVSLTGAAG